MFARNFRLTIQLNFHFVQLNLIIFGLWVYGPAWKRVVRPSHTTALKGSFNFPLRRWFIAFTVANGGRRGWRMINVFDSPPFPPFASAIERREKTIKTYFCLHDRLTSNYFPPMDFYMRPSPFRQGLEIGAKVVGVCSGGARERKPFYASHTRPPIYNFSLSTRSVNWIIWINFLNLMHDCARCRCLRCFSCTYAWNAKWK